MPMRPPATPLVTHDPYFSVWSTTDRLTDDWTRHWTGTVMALCGMARIDGKPFRWSGTHRREQVPAMDQKSLTVTPTRTVYVFEAGGVRLTATFLSPLLAHDLELVSRPLTYLTLSAESADGKAHAVSLYADVTGEWVTNTPDQAVVWNRYNVGRLTALRMGTAAQNVLGRSGDNVRCDWGYLYLGAARDPKTVTAMTSDANARGGFIEKGALPEDDDLRMPRPANDEWPVLAFAFDLGNVTGATERRLLLAYDDLYALEYFRRPVQAYWRRAGADAGTLLKAADAEHAKIDAAAKAFDAELTGDLKKFGEGYANLAALSYRQCLAAHKLAVDADGTLLYMSKENFSNGCIDTVDVTYPSAPFFLLLNPTLLKAQLQPILDYAKSPRWKFPFAPHDLGTYPLANGQVYGGGERSERDQMPVEECGNMLTLVAALTKVEGNAEFARRWWPTLTTWADYLRQKGLDPENQLCTDDFAGHLAHNANLSLKAIMALGGWAQVCEAAGKRDDAKTYRQAAEEMAKQWVKMADDGAHFRLAFDRAGTWSQKYNLVWDRILGLNLFPPDVAKKEVASYRKRVNKYGLPLDNRAGYTKLDWCVWTACLTGDRADFAAVVDPLALWLGETPSRVPLTDWYDTNTGKIVGFQARSVVGGVYLPLLYDETLWRKWSRR